MENGLTAARLALRHMLAVAADGRVSEDTTNQVLIGRTLAAREAIRTVDQGARYHPVREPAHVHYTGRLALGLDVNG
jgi:acyl-CoA dehydrogenase